MLRYQLKAHLLSSALEIFDHALLILLLISVNPHIDIGITRRP